MDTKQGPTTSYLQKIHFRSKDTHTFEVKDEKRLHTDSNLKSKNGYTVSRQNRLNQKMLQTQRTFIMAGSVHQEGRLYTHQA